MSKPRKSKAASPSAAAKPASELILYQTDDNQTRIEPELRSDRPKGAATPRRHRVIATPPSHFFRQRQIAAATGDEGVACTFLRRGVAATLRPASEFGIRRSALRFPHCRLTLNPQLSNGHALLRRQTRNPPALSQGQDRGPRLSRSALQFRPELQRLLSGEGRLRRRQPDSRLRGHLALGHRNQKSLRRRHRAARQGLGRDAGLLHLSGRQRHDGLPHHDVLAPRRTPPSPQTTGS